MTVTSIGRTHNAEAESERSLAVAEFFAGVGLARMGLEAVGFDIVWANDFDRDKVSMYEQHFGASDEHQLVFGDISDVHGPDLPHGLSLAWASFPCIDLSLAGNRGGIRGKHSGTFWHFTRILGEMKDDDRPELAVLENVVGLATSHGGADLAAAIKELNELGYSIDVLTLDARRFVPQSRPRLFVVGAKQPPEDEDTSVNTLRPAWLQRPFDNSDLRTHRAKLPEPPPLLEDGLSRVIEPMEPEDERWWDDDRKKAFLGSLSDIQAARLEKLRLADTLTYRTAYRRTRQGKPMWEIRADDIAGCLRTARGGSSKQAVAQAGKNKDGKHDVQVRWMTPLEYARLMGADDYKLDGLRRNQALFGFGDAVCVPAVAWLAENYLLPLVSGSTDPIEEPPMAASM